MRESEAALQEHLSQVAQAQLIAHAPEDDQQDDVVGYSRTLKGVSERSLKLCRHAAHGKVWYPSAVVLGWWAVVREVQWGQDMGHPQPAGLVATRPEDLAYRHTFA